MVLYNFAFVYSDLPHKLSNTMGLNIQQRQQHKLGAEGIVADLGTCCAHL